MFWSRKKEVTPTPPGGNRLDALANRLQQEGRIDSLESELGKFEPDTLAAAEKESWHHLHGIIAFRSGNRPLAFERFQRGVQQCPTSGQLRFSLGQEHEFRGEPDLMLACFDKALFPTVPAQYALAEARYAYLWGRHDKGWDYVATLIPAYLELKILDSTFLHVRGMPFFDQAWDYLAAFSRLSGDFSRITELTRKVSSACHEFDFDQLRAELDAFRSGDFSATKEKLRSSIKENQKRNFPHGYAAMLLQVLLSQDSADPTEASRRLDAVVLTERDFPWLNDIRRLAKCELANKMGDFSKEAELQHEFLKRQPLLFEPDHALNFNLLGYQEKLKAGYQVARRK